MSVAFKDYYDVLGLTKSASKKEIKQAYRKLARMYHPDNRKTGSDERFKEISEAYEVLSDPEKKSRYDQLGPNWKAGEDFRPPTGFGNVHFDFSSDDGGHSFSGGNFRSGFSDFFETLFGDRFSGGATDRGFRSWANPPVKGYDQTAQITISLKDAYTGAKKAISLHDSESGNVRTYEVVIPPRTRNGAKIRLGGQGGKGVDGGTPGDLYLTVNIAPDARFSINGNDLEAELRLAPWEAALGAKISVPTLEGNAILTVPPGTQSGRRFRLKGKGLGKPHGDLYYKAKIVVPDRLSEKERSHYEALARESTFSPRK